MPNVENNKQAHFKQANQVKQTIELTINWKISRVLRSIHILVSCYFAHNVTLFVVSS